MAKVIDPVCKMEVDPGTAPAKSEYGGTTYYFCAPGCKRAFDKDPEKYIRGDGVGHAHEAGQTAHGHGSHGGHCC
ncbi:MAG: YHS domain-containing protein [Limnochordaceae bacterium]|nr:YHS domain-containing protein [Limnochordaceae bacterium]